MEWTAFYFFCGASAVALFYGAAAVIISRRRKPNPEEAAPILDVSYTVCLLLDVANYLNADASKGGRDYRAKLEIEAQRLEAYQRGEK